ncbi:MAG: ATP-binding protein [ANME-2 cluster archaeon]|nr:MAG: ATP-binding protein [ANME-2 cluster archaeon]
MNLPHLIKTGESENIEFKEIFDERTIESAVAFSNTAGGCFIIGAEMSR